MDPLLSGNSSSSPNHFHSQAEVLIPLKLGVGMSLLVLSFLVSASARAVQALVSRRWGDGVYFARNFAYGAGCLLFSSVLLQIMPWSVMLLQQRWPEEGVTVAFLAMGCGSLLMILVHVLFPTPMPEKQATTEERKVRFAEDLGVNHHPYSSLQEVVVMPKFVVIDEEEDQETTPSLGTSTLQQQQEDMDNPFTSPLHLPTSPSSSGNPSIQVEPEQTQKKKGSQKGGARIRGLRLPRMTARQRSLCAGFLAGLVQSFLGGLAVGLQGDVVGTLLTALSVLAYDVSETLSLSATQRGSCGPGARVLLATAGGSLALVGILTGVMVSDVRQLTLEEAVAGAWNALDAGIFLYISLVDMILPAFQVHIEVGGMTRATLHRGNWARILFLLGVFVALGALTTSFF